MKKRQKFESMTRHGWKCLVAGALFAFAAGCGEEPTEPTGATAEHRLAPATSCDDVRDHLTESLTAEALDSLYGQRYAMPMEDTADAPAQDDADGSGGADSGETSEEPDDYTDTNVQEEGVDEPDIVKTDGTHIYTTVDGALRVLESWPPHESEVLGKAEFGDGVNPISMFLKDDRAIVLSNQWNRGPYGGGTEPGGGTDDGTDEQQEVQFGGTRISTFDVSDPADPTLVREVEIEGRFVDARMIDGDISLVSNSNLRSLSWWQLRDEEIAGELPEREWEEEEEDLAEMREEAEPLLKAFIAEELDEMETDEWIPRQRVTDSDGEVLTDGLMYECTDLYLPTVPAEAGALNITSLDAEDEDALSTTGLVANGWEVYASQQNLYVAMSSRSWWWGPWGAGDQDNESHIHKFKLLGNDDPQYMASGVVDGWILNQFSFSEYKNHLRVATTDNQWEWDEEAGESVDQGGNHMIVLKRQGDELVETGSVRDLAPTERIYSARFMGDRGFMVTFRFVDPFYTFDLSDPNNPEMLGELKIEGYSSYMHPIGEDHLLAIGQDGDDTGMMTGVHLQIFEVSDMENPERIAHETISTGSWSSWSEAMHDHRAFTYQEEHGILGIPINIRDDDDQFSGLMLFDIEAEEDGIEEIGRIDHMDLIAQIWCQNNGQTYGEDCDYQPNHYTWRSRMRRSIMMTGQDGDEYVYSLSDSGLKVNDVFDVDTEFASVLFD